MSYDRYNAYRIMWIFAMFDLPTETKNQRKTATQFRKALLDDGFQMFQYSVYVRHTSSLEQAKTHIHRIQEIIPAYGEVTLMTLTDKQYGRMRIFRKAKPEKTPEGPRQLSLF